MEQFESEWDHVGDVVLGGSGVSSGGDVTLSLACIMRMDRDP